MLAWPPFVKKHQNLIMALAYFGIIWPLYVFINHFELHHHFKRHVLEIWLDKLIPFEPIWVFFYASMYAFVLLPFIYVKEHKIYRHMWYSFCLTGLIAYVIFLIFPTYDIMRPVSNPFDFQRYFLALDNKHDSPYNCFPSLHVGFSMTAALWTYYVDKSRIGKLVLTWGILVSISVLLVKEHYIADLVGGAALASGLFYLFSRNLEKSIKTPRDQWVNNKLWLLVPIVLYLVELGIVLVMYWDRFKEAL